jgi:hypothetical protein
VIVLIAMAAFLRKSKRRPLAAPFQPEAESIGVVIIIWLRLYLPFTPCPSI